MTTQDDACHLLRRLNQTSRKLVVCSELCCEDKIDFEWPTERHQLIWLQSTKEGRRFQYKDITPQQDPLPTDPVAVDYKIKAYSDRTRHEVFGFGGAFTDAFGAQLDGLGPVMREKLLDSYFGPYGLQYTFGRVPIGGSDFSVRRYTYDDSDEPDLDLTHWQLAQEDFEFKMPHLSRAMTLCEAQNKSLKLIASPWSAPAWMKTNNKLVRGELIDQEAYYKSYANYIVKFLEAYASNGITFWGLTVQNEPVASFSPLYKFNSMHYNPESMVKFLGKFLLPALRVQLGWNKQTGLKIIIGDDSLGIINNQVHKILEDMEVAKYVSGFGYHWYLSGIVAPYSTLDKLHQSFEGKLFMIMTEACTGSVSRKKVDFGSWTRGEMYFEDIVQDLKHHTSAWIDWNMALDTHGGPNWAENFADSPIIVDNAAQEFWKQPMYYAIGHFSRTFQPGTKILEYNIEKRFYLANDIVAIVGLKPDTGHVIFNVMNKSRSRRRIRLQVRHVRAFGPIWVEPKSFNSFILKL